MSSTDTRNEADAANQGATARRKRRRAASAAAGAREKSVPRDERGRVLPGHSLNPAGRPPVTPELRAVHALAAEHRPACVARLVHIRDHSEDEWAQIEATKILLAYSDGKPVTRHNDGPLVAVQFNSGPASAPAVDPIDLVASLATDGHAMPDHQRERLVASVFEHAEAAAQRIAERQRPALIEAHPRRGEDPPK